MDNGRVRLGLVGSGLVVKVVWLNGYRAALLHLGFNIFENWTSCKGPYRRSTCVAVQSL